MNARGSPPVPQSYHCRGTLQSVAGAGPCAMRRAGAEGCDAVPVFSCQLAYPCRALADCSRSDFAPAGGFFTHRGAAGGTFTALHAPPPATLPLILSPVTRPEKRRVIGRQFTCSVRV
jgi:hypothetical protein